MNCRFSIDDGRLQNLRRHLIVHFRLTVADWGAYDLQLLQEWRVIRPEQLTALLTEANELVAISVAARKAARQAA